MIKPGEIQLKAQKVSVRDSQIEKDYVLSWVLKGIASHIQLAQVFVFKGGTVLKKAWFPDYRFSEDLDFTLLNEKITDDEIFKWFDSIFDYIKEEANIPLEIIKDNKHKDGSINFYIGYVGPLGGQGNNKRLKVDISRGEIMEFKPILKPLFLSYSDISDHKILCYSLEEMLTEKMRSVIQRTQPRDLYDLWYLLEIKGMDIALLQPEFERKAVNKGLNPKEFPIKLQAKYNVYRSQWKGSLNDQINDLPDFEKVIREISKQIRKLKFN